MRVSNNLDIKDIADVSTASSMKDSEYSNSKEEAGLVSVIMCFFLFSDDLAS